MKEIKLIQKIKTAKEDNQRATKKTERQNNKLYTK